MISEIYFVNTSRMENEGASTVCPLDPGSPLFLFDDGFELADILFPHAAFHLPSKDKKEAYDFMDKVRSLPLSPKNFFLKNDFFWRMVFMFGLRQASPLMRWEATFGLKRQTLEAQIARVERKVRAMESDSFQWEWRNFDCVAKI